MGFGAAVGAVSLMGSAARVMHVRDIRAHTLMECRAECNRNSVYTKKSRATTDWAEMCLMPIYIVKYTCAMRRYYDGRCVDVSIAFADRAAYLYFTI